MNQKYIHSDLTDKIIGCAYKVYNKLGKGFLEKVYENALVIELKQSNLSVSQQYPIKVYYNDVIIGDYFADLLVEDKIIIEIKAIRNLNTSHEVQLVNYLKATGKQVGLLINFGDKIQIKRRVLQQSSTNQPN